ncbi:hypothetical protein CEP54_008307 [Fusarium duplospermum]|uniref:Uncharacterized protein n=1 Tax=Fusarium duplospermum TaxID=1325734 RepID=A0A428PWI1_9HYPO|nr:hypothetical protein CEP54_008307 [Fusarium duplospermum]
MVCLVKGSKGRWGEASEQPNGNNTAITQLKLIPKSSMTQLLTSKTSVHGALSIEQILYRHTHYWLRVRPSGLCHCGIVSGDSYVYDRWYEISRDLICTTGRTRMSPHC